MDPALIIVGAGAAGLSTAHELYRRGFSDPIVILEAAAAASTTSEQQQQTAVWGGRVRQGTFSGRPVNLGAEWIQSRRNRITDVETAAYEPPYWYFEDNSWIQDVNYTFGYHTFVNDMTWYEYLRQTMWEDMFSSSSHPDPGFYNGCEVTLIETTNATATDEAASTTVACQDGRSFIASVVVVTVSLPALQNIEFIPAWGPQIAAQGLGWMPAAKLFVQFSQSFYRSAFSLYPDTAIAEGSLSDEDEIFCWDTMYELGQSGTPEDTHVLGILLVGHYYNAIASGKTKEQILQRILSELDNAHGGKRVASNSYLSHVFLDWVQEPNIQGGWSRYFEWEMGDSPAFRRRLQQLLASDGRLYLAGEAFAPDGEYGLVTGAILSGQTTACRILGGIFEGPFTRCSLPLHVPIFSPPPRPMFSTSPTVTPTMASAPHDESATRTSNPNILSETGTSPQPSIFPSTISMSSNAEAVYSSWLPYFLTTVLLWLYA